MRRITCLTLLAFVPLSVSALLIAQQDGSRGEPAVTVHSLTLVSADLAGADRDRLVRTFQGGQYTPEELAERVRQAVRDEGYANATTTLDGVKDSDDGRSADITLRITAGRQYRLADIHFAGASLFPAQKLRALFPVENGALFNATAIGRGLDGMKKLYDDMGHLEISVIPKLDLDETRQTVAVQMDLDEGKTFYFGRLLLDGVEPRPGAAQALQGAWASLRQKPYSPKALDGWLAAHAPYWPGSGQPIDHVSLTPNSEAQQVNVLLQFP